MKKVIINIDKCKGCGLCIAACPKNIIRMSAENLNQKGFYPAEVIDSESCIACAMCAMMCPDCAIRVEKESL